MFIADSIYPETVKFDGQDVDRKLCTIFEVSLHMSLRITITIRKLLASTFLKSFIGDVFWKHGLLLLSCNVSVTYLIIIYDKLDYVKDAGDEPPEIFSVWWTAKIVSYWVNRFMCQAQALTCISTQWYIKCLRRWLIQANRNCSYIRVFSNSYFSSRVFEIQIVIG